MSTPVPVMDAAFAALVEQIGEDALAAQAAASGNAFLPALASPSASPAFYLRRLPASGRVVYHDGTAFRDMDGSVRVVTWDDIYAALLRATFTAADGTAVTALTNEVGPAWANYVLGTSNTPSTDLVVQSNRLASTANSDTLALRSAGSAAPTVITATLYTSGPGHYAGVVFRCIDADHFLHVVLDPDGGAGAGVLRFYNRDAGWTQIAEVSGGWTFGGADFALRIEDNLDEVRVRLNGTLVLTVNATAHLAGTLHGLRIINTGARADNHIVYDAAAAPAP
jgi:hypothetical protein